MSSLKDKLSSDTRLAAPAILRATRDEVEHVNRTRHFTMDSGSMMTFDQFTRDSTGAFLIGELERLDPTLHEPLVSVTWGRDVDLREDVTLADDTSSFTNSSFASPGGIIPSGKAWISTDTNAITGVALDIGKTAQPLYLWGMELKYTLPELASAQKVGRPIDVQKYDGMKLKYQMDIDEMVYIGDTTYGRTGLFNNAAVDTSNVVNGAQGSSTWLTKSPDEILDDVNAILTAAWTNTGFAVVPTDLRVPPVQWGTLLSRKVSTAGNVSILEFLRNNSMSNAKNGQPLNIQPVKWLTGRGAAGSDRMVAYTRNRDYVRYPLVPLQRTPLEFRSIYQITTYYGRLGCMEFVYPETLSYRDGI
jgi:hypothetical protein